MCCRYSAGPTIVMGTTPAAESLSVIGFMHHSMKSRVKGSCSSEPWSPSSSFVKLSSSGISTSPLLTRRETVSPRTSRVSSTSSSRIGKSRLIED